MSLSGVSGGSQANVAETLEQHNKAEVREMLEVLASEQSNAVSDLNVVLHKVNSRMSQIETAIEALDIAPPVSRSTRFKGWFKENAPWLAAQFDN